MSKTYTLKKLWGLEEYKNAMIEMLKSVGINDIDNIMELDDVLIYSKLHELYISKNTISQMKSEKKRNNEILANHKFEYIKKYIPLPKNPKILDVGTMDCSFIEKLKSIDGAQVNGINVKEFTQFSYHTNTDCVQIYDGVDIPIKDNDLVIVLMVLHHVPKENLEKLLKSIYKSMKHDSYLLIREHDVNNNNDILYINWMHFFYELICEEKSAWDFYRSYVPNYMSKDELESILNKIGFTNVKHLKPKNITRNYFTLFKK